MTNLLFATVRGARPNTLLRLSVEPEQGGGGRDAQTAPSGMATPHGPLRALVATAHILLKPVWKQHAVSATMTYA